MIKCYLVRQGHNRWYIARPGVERYIEPGTPPGEYADAPLRVCWVERDSETILCFDIDHPEIVPLPD
jgi:hypothetical protein